MNRKIITASLITLGAWALAAWGGIPEPDAVLYGTLRIDGWRQRATDTDVAVFATVEVGGTQQTIARYRMGDSAPVGDRYVLRIRLESLADGSTQSDNAALVGQTARLFIQKGVEPPVEAATFLITSPGAIQSMDLGIGVVPDIDGDGDADLRDVGVFQLCFTGSAGGSVPSGCAVADLDSDNDVDLADLGALAPRVAGP